MQTHRVNPALSLIFCLAITANAQLARRDATPAPQPTAAHRTRLYLKDGSYQVVLRYIIKGDNVSYLSAERGGELEDVPLKLVDLPATERWAREHAAPADSTAAQRTPAVDPELAREEADRAAMTPEIAPNLRLPAEDSVLALDTYEDAPELVPVLQTDGQITRGQTHNTLKSLVNPRSSTHTLLVLKGERAPVQMHVNDPIFYIHLDDDMPDAGGALTVDTHGASTAASRSRKTPATAYVITRLDVRENARVVSSFNPALLGSGAETGRNRQEDVFETDSMPLAGGHWLQVKPRQPLLVGEYALVEVLSDREINLGVWDFGVHPTGPENRDVVKPEEPRRNGLEKRRP